jgi:hypothetical protein
MIDKYKKWVFYTGVTSVIVCLFHLILVFYFFKVQSYELLWIHNCLIKKEAFARSTRGMKIVFAGGSATLFGIRTKDVQETLGIHCVNMGLHGGVKLDYLLFRLKQILQPGDVVILPLEYEHFIYDGSFDDTTSDFIISYDKAFINSLPLLEKIKCLSHVSPIKLGKSLGGVALFGEIKELDLAKGYNSSTLNTNGDETNNIGEKMDRSLAVFKPVPIQTGDFSETIGLKMLKDFNTWCYKNRILAHISYANTLLFSEYENDMYRNYFYNLQRYFYENRIATIGTPYNFFFKKQWFYDTQYHMNQEGAIMRTRQFIAMMTSLGIAEKNDNVLPAKIGRSAFFEPSGDKLR